MEAVGGISEQISDEGGNQSKSSPFIQVWEGILGSTLSAAMAMDSRTGLFDTTLSSGTCVSEARVGVDGFAPNKNQLRKINEER